MDIGNLCSLDPVTAPTSTRVRDIAMLMRRHHVGCVVLTKSPIDRPVPAGMLTDRDIVYAQAERDDDVLALPAAQIMSPDPLVLQSEWSLEQAIERLRARGVRRAPVVDRSGSLVGLLSLDDVIGVLVDDLRGVASLIGTQPREEAMAHARVARA